MQNNLEIIKQTKYLLFIIKEHKPKTKVVAVVNKKSTDEIGVIRWHSPWRQYCFLPHGNTIWNTGCLNDINDMIAELKPVRPKPKQKTVAVVAHTINDFLDWKRKKRYKDTSGVYTTKRIFNKGNNRYVCVTQPHHVHGFSIDKVIETEQAYLNPKLYDIMNMISCCLISPKKK